MGSGKKEAGRIGQWQKPREEVEATSWCGGEHEEGMEWVRAKGIPRWIEERRRLLGGWDKASDY